MIGLLLWFLDLSSVTAAAQPRPLMGFWQSLENKRGVELCPNGNFGPCDVYVVDHPKHWSADGAWLSVEAPNRRYRSRYHLEGRVLTIESGPDQGRYRLRMVGHRLVENPPEGERSLMVSSQDGEMTATFLVVPKRGAGLYLYDAPGELAANANVDGRGIKEGEVRIAWADDQVALFLRGKLRAAIDLHTAKAWTHGEPFPAWLSGSFAARRK